MADQNIMSLTSSCNSIVIDQNSLIGSAIEDICVSQQHEDSSI